MRWRGLGTLAESALAMSVLELDELLREISSDAPSGENLEYDPVFGQMERSAQGKPEQEVGETFVEAAEADWSDVKIQALTVLSRSRDIRAAVYLARAALHTDGFPGFRDGLLVLRAYIERFWESVHPQLDADDDNDPTMRVNILVALRDGEATLQPVREATLAVSRVLGRFSYHDVQVADGESAPRGNAPPVEMATILAAFDDCDLDELRTTAEAVGSSAESVAAIDARVTEQVGSGQAADLSALTDLLGRIKRFLDEQLQRRGVSSEPKAVPSEAAGSGRPSGDDGESSRGGAMAANGEIHSREDVIRTIDRVCEYYQQHEPSSPIPLLLTRAKRLVHKSFLEILEDLAPDGLSEVYQKWGGSDDGADGLSQANHAGVSSRGEPVESGDWS